MLVIGASHGGVPRFVCGLGRGRKKKPWFDLAQPADQYCPLGATFPVRLWARNQSPKAMKSIEIRRQPPAAWSPPSAGSSTISPELTWINADRVGCCQKA
jgi:hypothetical protein